MQSCGSEVKFNEATNSNQIKLTGHIKKARNQ